MTVEKLREWWRARKSELAKILRQECRAMGACTDCGSEAGEFDVCLRCRGRRKRNLRRRRHEGMVKSGRAFYVLPKANGARYVVLPGFDSYAVGSDGTVWSRRSRGGSRAIWMKLKRCLNAYGYCVLALRHAGSTYRRMVNRMVLEGFLGPAPPGTEAAHLNGVRDDNRLENLAWKTPKENAKDKEIHGTHRRGEDCPYALMTEADVRLARSMRWRGMTPKEIGEILGFKPHTVGAATRGDTWKHVV